MAAMAAFTFSSCEDVPEPYTQPTQPGAGGTTDGEPKGTGTSADPFNSIAAINYCKTLEAGVESDKEVYIKGCGVILCCHTVEWVGCRTIALCCACDVATA